MMVNKVARIYFHYLTFHDHTKWEEFDEIFFSKQLEVKEGDY